MKKSELLAILKSSLMLHQATLGVMFNLEKRVADLEIEFENTQSMNRMYKLLLHTQHGLKE